MANDRLSGAAGKARAGASKAKASATQKVGGGGGFEEVSWSRTGLINGNRNGDQPWHSSESTGTQFWKSRWAWLAPLLAIAFLIPAFLFAYDHIEDDIQDAGPQILAQEGIDPTGLTFDATFRNIEVGGVLPAGVSAELIEETLEENNWDFDGEDVRNVTVTATAAAIPDPGPIDVDVTSDGSTIVLTGAVPSEQHRTELIEAAEATGLPVEETITVSGLEPSSDDADAQIGRMGAVIGGLAVGNFASANLSIGDDGPVTGNIEALDAAGAATFNDLVGGENVDVGAPEELGPLDVDVTYDGTRIVLDGTVSMRLNATPSLPPPQTSSAKRTWSTTSKSANSAQRLRAPATGSTHSPPQLEPSAVSILLMARSTTAT